MGIIKAFITRFHNDKRGAQIVEFAILLPIFLFLVFGIVDFGRGFFSWVIITNGAREGARYAAVGKTQAQIVNKVWDPVAGTGAVGGLYITGVQSGTSSSACTSATNGALCIYTNGVGGYPDTPVTVSVRYNFKFIVLPNIMTWAGGGSLPGGVFPLTAGSTMRIE